MPQTFMGRHLFFNDGGAPLPTLMLVQVKQAVGPGSNPGPIVTLDATPTPGNILIAGYGGGTNINPAQTSGPTLTRIGHVQQAHATFGSVVNTYYRIVQAGDTAAYGFDNINNSGLLVAEFSGLTGMPTLGIEDGGNVGTTLSRAMSGTALDVGFAMFVTRLEPGGAFTPNGSSTQVGTIVYPNGSIGGVILVYGSGSATLGGTQGGTTRDGYNWGGTSFLFAKRGF